MSGADAEVGRGLGARVRTAELTAPVDAAFYAMTYPVYRHLLALAPAPRHPEQGETVCVAPVAIGAWLDGEPVGLLLAETPLAGTAGADVRPQAPSAVPMASGGGPSAAVAAVAGMKAEEASAPEAAVADAIPAGAAATGAALAGVSSAVIAAVSAPGTAGAVSTPVAPASAPGVAAAASSLATAEAPAPAATPATEAESGQAAANFAPAALAAAPASSAGRVPEVLSIFVAQHARRLGVAGALLRALEATLGARGFAGVEAVYTTGRAGSAAVEALLARGGWSAPVTRTVLVHLVPGEFVDSALFDGRRLRELDPGFEIFAWADLPAAERAALQESDERQRWVTPGLAAWKYDTAPFDRAASVGARYRGQVVGWVIAQQIDATAVRYLASFLRKDLSRRGRILPLYRESLVRAAAAGRQLATFVTPVIYPSMIRFIHKWMAPHARLVAETRGASRRLAPGEAPGAP